MPVRLNGSTSGYVELAAPAVAGSTSLTLPVTGFGKVLQVVFGQMVSGSVSNDSSTHKDTGLSATITPTSASSKVLILVSQPIYITKTAANQGMGLKLLRGSTVILDFSGGNTNALYLNAAVGYASIIEAGSVASMNYLDSPATTSATTYKTTMGLYSTGSGSACYANNLATMILMEVGP